MEPRTATQPVKDELQDLLHGLKVVRDRLDAGRPQEARQVLEAVGHRLAALINDIRIAR